MKYYFLKFICFLCAVMILSDTVNAQNKKIMPKFPNGTKILFQGDSITDGGRGRSADPNHILGHSYVFLIAAPAGARFPEKNWTFINRGISGNKITDLAARWQKDALDLKPDILSILIGINDADSIISKRPAQVSAEEFEKVYDELLRQTIENLPNVKLVLGEPFVVSVGKLKTNFDDWSAETKKRQMTIEKLAAKYHAPVVKFQKVFDEAAKRAPADYWIWDGIHPTYAGQQLMADEWIRVVNEFYFGKKSKGKK